MLKITRRPYTSCPFRWSLSTSGISTGEGDCSEAQCLDLNGDFALDFSACASKGDKLVWDGDCEPSGGGKGCNGFILTASIDVTGFDCASTYSGTFVFRSLNPSSTVTDDCLNFFQCSYYATKPGNRLYFMPTTECKPACSTPTTEEASACGSALFGGTVSHCLSVLELAPVNTVYMIQANPSFPLLIDHGCMDFTADHVPNYYYDSMTTDVDGCPLTVTYTKASDAYSGSVVGTWPSEIVFTVTTGGSGSTGPETNDRIRSKWHLEYDIEAQLWTLRSFNRIDYPIYTLSDSDPCTGYTKTLLLADKGDSADGCGVAPSEVTITRVCPPDRVGKSALLEDRKPNGATGKTKRQCGCDCQDEVDDRRSCATKCTSTEDEGCENIDPAPDDITCRYPEAINCCENTAGLDVPCAYTVEFECDLFFDIESVRHKIAAKQVVMRRKCYFENGCEFVAAGPESSTGGSPVMDTDGFPGAQPVCSSCSDLCLTGCTWSAWTVAECPPGSPSLCPLTADKTKCLEFRWYDVQTTSYTAGDVAATLAFTSETIDPTGRILWVFTSEDGEWVATIYPNTLGVPRVWCAQGGTYCGSGSLSWNNAPAGFPNSVWPSNEWMTETFYTDFVCSNNSIADSGIFFDGNEFGSAYTTLRMYWIDCP
jgi:hypothetical protein